MKDSAIGYWRTRNGSYAVVHGETTYGTFCGLIFQEDGKPFCRAEWDRKFNYPISRDYDLMNRFTSREEKGWPEWLVNLAGRTTVVPMEDTK